MAVIAKRNVIVLNYSSSGQVTVEAQDEDRFVISASKAVEACKQHKRNEETIRTFKQKFLQPLHNWCKEHTSKVQG